MAKTWTLLKESAEAGCIMKAVPEMRSANDRTSALAWTLVFDNVSRGGLVWHVDIASAQNGRFKG